MTDVIPRIPGYSNEMMHKHCEILKAVVTTTKEVKIGRGRSTQIINVPVNSIDKQVYDRIINSCKYYKDMENKKVGSFEVVKYRLDYIDGQPKIIIEMIKVLDTNGDYIKFARLKDVIGYLSKYPIVFKQT